MAPAARVASRVLSGVAAVALAVLATSCSDANPNFSLDHCVVSVPPASAVDDAGAPRLHVASVNMWGIPYVSAHVEERFAALVERLRRAADIDVVGLQEVWDDDARARLLDGLRAAFPHQVDFHGIHGRSGLALLSRRPFVEAPRFHGFTETGKWWKPWNGEWFGGKGIGAVRVRVGDGDGLWVAVTHLHACYDEGAPLACDRTDEFAVYRRRQLEEVRSFVNEVAGPAPAVVLGDFNFTPTSTDFEALRRGGDGTGHDPGWQHVGEHAAPPTRIDHVWLRPGRDGGWRALAPAQVAFVEPIEVGARRIPLSDHCMITATIAP